MIERTLAIIKPDGVKKRVVGEIIRRYEKNKLYPVAIKSTWLTKAEAESFYCVHRERPFFSDLTAFMSSGPIVVMALEGEDAIMRHRELMGATDPLQAAEGTIRKDFAESIDCNIVHGSDANETAKDEIGFFFDNNSLHSIT